MDFKTDFKHRIVDLKDGYIKDIDLYEDKELDYFCETYHLDVTFIVTTDDGEEKKIIAYTYRL